ncbi:DUF1275 domain-containing protein [Microbacterium sp. VKM Ac-2870]|uniref:YoaK family protein n=1 Tax=Microbacterium sp. VKM Ac-2870 TaxID=2783825 RepID=UPI00188A93D5|nr:YoaK family protein [Microbacterium sp. VKM Ac-2870]MBF4562536.1 DUF1275 domain-containing protein [Microbacterium sp. VKM Ac-2870]
MTIPNDRDRPSLDALAVVLSFAAGATDAFAFLQLGGIFTANMTGNVVLSGLITRPDYPATLTGAIVAVVVFSGVVFAGFRVTRGAQVSTRRLGSVMGCGLAAQLAVAGIWAVDGGRRGMVLIMVVVALSTTAMALQTVIGRRVEVRSRVATTFVTGAITTLMKDAADGDLSEALVRIGTIVALAAGALCGAAVMTVDVAAGAVLPVIPSAVGLVLLLVARRQNRRRPDQTRG